MADLTNKNFPTSSMMPSTSSLVKSSTSSSCPSCGSGSRMNVPQQSLSMQLEYLKNTYKLQPWLTAFGGTGTGDVIQPMSRWYNATDHSLLMTQIQISCITNCTLHVESAEVVEGPWTSCVELAATADQVRVLSSEGGNETFSRLVRWRIETGNDWRVCFKLLTTPDKGMSDRFSGSL